MADSPPLPPRAKRKATPTDYALLNSGTKKKTSASSSTAKARSLLELVVSLDSGLQELDVYRQLEYVFDEPSLGFRISVILDRSAAQETHAVWLDYVAPLYDLTLPQVVFARYRQLCPPRARTFRRAAVGEFSEFLRARADFLLRDAKSRPAYTITQHESDKLLQMESEQKRNVRKSAAKRLRDETQSVMNDVDAKMSRVAFASQRGQDNYRTALLTTPTVSTETESGSIELSGVALQPKRKKRRLAFGLSMPAPREGRGRRREEKLQHGANADKDFQYLTFDQKSESYTVRDQLDEGQVFEGLVFSPARQIERTLKRCIKNGAVNERCLAAPPADPSAAPPVTLRLVWGGDGITPTHCPVCCFTFKLLDPERHVFKSGCSPLMRLIDTWGPESSLRQLAALRNSQLTFLLSSM
jgi:hypothetical protein